MLKARISGLKAVHKYHSRRAGAKVAERSDKETEERRLLHRILLKGSVPV